jgi:hypothetical protein
MQALGRSYWLTVLVCAYAAAAALSSRGVHWIGLVSSLGAPFGLAFVWRFAHQREKRAEPGVEAKALRALCAVVAGSVVWGLSRLGQPQVIALELLGTLGLGTASVAALYALARIPAAPGLLVASKSARSVDAAAFAGFLWSIALGVAAKDLVVADLAALDPLTYDYAITAASIGSLLILFAAALRLRWVRRLELGVGDRAFGALTFSVTAIAVAIPAAAMDIAPPDRMLPAALVVACLCAVACVVVADPSSIAKALRGTMVVVGLGVPIALLAGSLGRALPQHTGPIALATAVLCVLVGLIARAAARPLGPEQSRWLEALAEARVAALVPEPELAIQSTLRALKGTALSPQARPELWRRDPASVLSVNVSGTLETRDQEAPLGVYELGEREPERTLRVEVLRALEVRRPEVRPLLEWFEVHKAFSATIVVDDDGPIGFLLLPAGGRTDVMTLEEAMAARSLADRVSALLSVTSAMERARRRQLEARAEAERWEQEFHRVEAVLEGAAERHRVAARALARPLFAAAYSPAVRLLWAEVERATASSRVVSFVTPPGVDATAWAARLHLAWRLDGPLFCVDGGVERSEQAWSTPSPVDLCARGTLFVRDAELLSPGAQELLVQQITLALEQAARVEPPRLVLGFARHPAELQQEGSLGLLQAWVQKDVFQLPTLLERPEDMRALVLDLASRHLRGSERAPLGVERGALQALLDYNWPGNDAELRDVILRAGAVATGPLITLQDLRAIGFAGLIAAPPMATTSPERAEHAALDVRPDYRPRSRPPRSRRRR